MEQSIKISNSKVVTIGVLCCLATVMLWINRAVPLIDMPKAKTVFPVIEIFFTVISLLFLMSYLKRTKSVKVIAFIIAIPVLPFMIIGLLSQTKPFVRLTLPLMAFPMMAIVIYYLVNLLKLLELGVQFDTKVIPYLTLTLVTISLAYFDKAFIRIAAKMISDKGMPQLVKDWTFELIDKKIFIKLSYFLITLLTIIATIERLYGSIIIDFFSPYKQISMESLITFVAIDRFIGKWKI